MNRVRIIFIANEKPPSPIFVIALTLALSFTSRQSFYKSVDNYMLCLSVCELIVDN